MKKFLLLGAFAFLGGLAQAQEGFRLGAHVGAPLGDASDAASVTLGIDAAYMWNITKGLDIGAATGYSHFFGKDNVEDFGFIPLAVSGKYTFNKLPLFVGLDLGAAISTRDYINSGLYVAPRVGYQLNRKTELYLGFQNIGSRYKHRGPGPGPYWHGDDRFSFGAVNFGANFFLK